jgi:hypothetical protein
VSPSGLAVALGERLGNISYHVGILRNLGYVELVRTEPSRGALEHFYRATTGPRFDDEHWVRLAAAMRIIELERTLTAVLDDAAVAGRQGGFDGPEAHVSRTELNLDPEARTQLTALLAATREAALRIHADSAARQAQSRPDSPPTIATELAILHLVLDD